MDSEKVSKNYLNFMVTDISSIFPHWEEEGNFFFKIQKC